MSAAEAAVHLRLDGAQRRLQVLELVALMGDMPVDGVLEVAEERRRVGAVGENAAGERTGEGGVDRHGSLLWVEKDDRRFGVQDTVFSDNITSFMTTRD